MSRGTDELAAALSARRGPGAPGSPSSQPRRRCCCWAMLHFPRLSALLLLWASGVVWAAAPAATRLRSPDTDPPPPPWLPY
ncbi:Uncharacterized protein PODLI_1B014909, partial [Podarcis lilfordi]